MTTEETTAALRHTWHFPLPRTHTGALLGNGTLGVMVWGEENILRITLGRADWWDHRGGRQWTGAMNFAAIRRLLEAGDEPGIRSLFSAAPERPGEPRQPSVLPIGRFELVFPEAIKLAIAVLDMREGEISVFATDETGNRLLLGALDIALRSPVLRLRFAANAPLPRVVCVPAWEHVGCHLRSISFREPEIKSDGSGWTQQTPAPDDANLTVRHAFAGRDEWRVSVALDSDGDSKTAADHDFLAASFEARAAWWRDYWRRVPRVDVPGGNWNFLYHYGLYKFASLTAPQGIAATLQGPWIEEYQMPPWSGDYHFNINVQMCYWPAFQSGLWEHLTPLFAMIERWLPILRQNAKKFAGIDDGYLLPHAVDDRCGIIGSFWTGTIDHACTAWIGKMMYDYWHYTGDAAFLRRLAFPFMVGVMKVYSAMFDRLPDGSLSMPVSVSPEYRGASMNAWGRNASFQLAACHWLANALETAAAVLGESPDPVWREIRSKLPKASLVSISGNAGGGGGRGAMDAPSRYGMDFFPRKAIATTRTSRGFVPLTFLIPTISESVRSRPIARDIGLLSEWGNGRAGPCLGRRCCTPALATRKCPNSSPTCGSAYSPTKDTARCTTRVFPVSR
ncbi:hypothetical protein Ga0100230_013945 [Opitutaceae bacterium TAV3]|nr:hypothetical protein Ga0100230_013945 [Opitutaceae bacterium TAV3]